MISAGDSNSDPPAPLSQPLGEPAAPSSLDWAREAGVAPRVIREADARVLERKRRLRRRRAAAAGSALLVLFAVAVGDTGRTLKDHWELQAQNFIALATISPDEVRATIRRFEEIATRDPSVSLAKAAVDRQQTLLAALNRPRHHWDIVVLQSYRDDLAGDACQAIGGCGARTSRSTSRGRHGRACRWLSRSERPRVESSRSLRIAATTTTSRSGKHSGSRRCGSGHPGGARCPRVDTLVTRRNGSHDRGWCARDAPGGRC